MVQFTFQVYFQSIGRPKKQLSYQYMLHHAYNRSNLTNILGRSLLLNAPGLYQPNI